MLAYSPSLLNRLAAEKQLFAKACPCTVDKVEPRSDIHFSVLHTILLDTSEEYANNLVYNIECSHTELDLYRSTITMPRRGSQYLWSCHWLQQQNVAATSERQMTRIRR
jgi:hypothetical protein